MIETSDPNDSEPLQAFKKKLKNLKQLLQLMLHQVERIHDEPLKELKAAIDKKSPRCRRLEEASQHGCRNDKHLDAVTSVLARLDAGDSDFIYRSLP